MIPRPSGPGFADWLPAAGGRDPATGAPAMGPAAGDIEQSGLDARTHALVRLAALVASDPSRAALDEQVATALDYGVTAEEIAGVLAALLPALGVARIGKLAPDVLGALDRATADIPAPPA